MRFPDGSALNNGKNYKNSKKNILSEKETKKIDGICKLSSKLLKNY
jgi:hypothetical protein